VSTAVLVIVSLVAPAIIILLIVMIFVPGPTARGAGKAMIWRRKLWEWNTGWLGLALSLALAFMLTDGMKNLFGKPRPDLIARCIPDVANLQKYVVGGLGNQVPDGQFLVSWQICTQKDMAVLNDGFAAFPSGHSSCMFPPELCVPIKYAKSTY
jgi:membrane-associated phospholipid phosphatase